MLILEILNMIMSVWCSEKNICDRIKLLIFKYVTNQGVVFLQEPFKIVLRKARWAVDIANMCKIAQRT